MQTDIEARGEVVAGNVCLCCLSSSNLRSFLLTNYDNGQPEIYANMISECFCIQLTSDVDHEYMICDECISRLREAFSFRLLVEIAQKTIQSDFVDEEKDCTSKRLELYFHEVDMNFDDDFLTNEEEIVYTKEIIKKPKYCKSAKSRTAAKSNDLKLKCNNVDAAKSDFDTLGENSKVQKRSNKKLKLETHKYRDDNGATDDYDNEEYGTLPEILDIECVEKKKNDTGSSTEKKNSGKVKSDEKPYKLNKTDLTCKICNETFAWHTTLERHMSIHFPNHICHICARFFTKKSSLMTHVLRHKHSQDVHTCDVCNKQYKGAENLRNHMRHHISPTGVYKCPQCPVRFPSYYKRVKHLIDVHDDEAKKYKCKHCSKRYFQACTLSRHVKAVHLQERRHVCQKCGNSFFDKSGLDEHMLKHTGIKNFHCEICTKSYGRRFTLTEHMKIHNNVKNYVCPVCARAFTQKCTLKGHMKVHEKVQVKILPDEDN